VKPEVKETFGRTRYRCSNNIKTSVNVIGWDGVYWIFWLRIGKSGGDLMNALMNLRVP